ncbi:MAG: metal ABC transporter permease [Planctomycetia bacterium]|nr:metal ABC transporter permease [Planctomycetia bacterium]
MDIFQYDFIQRAFLVGTFLAIVLPCIGITIVLKRLSMMGETLAHTSLAGVTFGLIMGFNPTLCATIYCAVAALGIEILRKRFPQFAEMAIAVILSAGIGLTAILSSFVKSASNFQSFLFGSIVAVSDFELGLIIGVSALVLASSLLLYKELFYVAFDETAARMAGVPVGLVNFIFTILTAVTVSVAARTVGALIVSSLLVIPVAAAMQLGKSYRGTLIVAVLFSVFTMNAGLYISCLTNTKPGGAVVMLEIGLLLLFMFWNALKRRSRKKF